MRPRRDACLLIFVLLWGSYAYFWQGRDWNNASRLMLTYALVDRGTLSIDGLEIHVGGDLARGPDGRLYTEKAPGQSFLGVPVYALLKVVGGYPDHPLNLPQARPYWWRDYWVTLGTSGLLTAILGVVLYAFALRLGTSHSMAVLLAVAYGLSTPAFTYATLFYGHQSAALAATMAFYLLFRSGTGPRSVDVHWLSEGVRSKAVRLFTAGFLAGFAVVIELPMLLICGVLWLYGLATQRSRKSCGWLTLGMATAGGVLLTYNTLAFGNPFTISYKLVTLPMFRQAHDNPLVVGAPNWGILPELFFSSGRGLFVYAPVMLLVPVAVVVLGMRRRWALVLVPLSALAGLLLVNISHRFWEGGLATGPRFLLPAVPLLMLPLAGVLGTLEANSATGNVSPRDRPNRLPQMPTVTRRRGTHVLRGSFVFFLILAAMAGMVIITACTATGGRFGYVVRSPGSRVEAESRVDPLTTTVVPRLAEGQLAPNGGKWLFGPEAPWWLQLLPLGGFWLVLGTFLVVRLRRESGSSAVRGDDG